MPLRGEAERPTYRLGDRLGGSGSDLVVVAYHALGVPRNPRIPANADPAFFDLGLCGPRRERVADDSLCGAFKVPTLRNVARRRSFMHNGFF